MLNTSDTQKASAQRTDAVPQEEVSNKPTILQTVVSNDKSTAKNIIATTATSSCIVVGVEKPITSQGGFVQKRATGYDCHVCQKIFITPSGLKKHSVIHSDLRPFPCQLCDKSFKRSDHLSSHMVAIHNQIKFMYGCSVDGCQKEFREEKSCRAHIREHLQLLKGQVKVSVEYAKKDESQKDHGQSGSSQSDSVENSSPKVVTKYISLLSKPRQDVSGSGSTSKPAAASATTLPIHTASQSDSSSEKTCILPPKEISSSHTSIATKLTTSQSPAVKSESCVTKMPPSDTLLKALNVLAEEVRKKAVPDPAGGDVSQFFTSDGDSTNKQDVRIISHSKIKVEKSSSKPVTFTTSIPVSHQAVKANFSPSIGSHVGQPTTSLPPVNPSSGVVQHIPVSVSFSEDKTATLRLFVPLKSGSVGYKGLSQAAKPLTIKVPLDRNISESSGTSGKTTSVSTSSGLKIVEKSITAPSEKTPSKSNPVHAMNPRMIDGLTKHLPSKMESASTLCKASSEQTRQVKPSQSVTVIKKLENYQYSKSDLTCHVCKRVFHSVRARCGHARVHQSIGTSQYKPNRIETNHTGQLTSENKVITSSLTAGGPEIKSTCNLGMNANEKIDATKPLQRIIEVTVTQDKMTNKESQSTCKKQEETCLPTSTSEVTSQSSVGVVPTADCQDRNMIAVKVASKNCTPLCSFKEDRTTTRSGVDLTGKSILSNQNHVDNLLKTLYPSLGLNCTVPPILKTTENQGMMLDDCKAIDDGHLQYKYNCNIYWQPNEIHRFQIGLLNFGKNFEDIATYVETKSVSQCAKFYYVLEKLKPSLQSSPLDRNKQEPRGIDYGEQMKTLEGKKYEGYVGSVHNGIFKVAKPVRKYKQLPVKTGSASNVSDTTKLSFGVADVMRGTAAKVVNASGGIQESTTRKRVKDEEKRLELKKTAKKRKFEDCCDKRATEHKMICRKDKSYVKSEKFMNGYRKNPRNRKLKVKLPIFSKKKSRDGQKKGNTLQEETVTSQHTSKKMKETCEAKQQKRNRLERNLHKNMRREERCSKRARNSKKQICCSSCMPSDSSAREAKSTERKRRKVQHRDKSEN
ncbi:uncharacterized protein [Ptychodera flava]|uniref:uncharacterized protein isoform X2 n=1 Tax=Ptychodera flava TaxID=63121 RepID=UPI00396AB06F